MNGSLRAALIRPKAATAQVGQMIWRRSSALVSKPPQRPLVTRCSLGKHYAATREQFKVAARTTGPVDRNAHRRPYRLGRSKMAA